MRETRPYLMIYRSWKSAASSTFNVPLSNVSPLCKELSDTLKESNVDGILFLFRVPLGLLQLRRVKELLSFPPMIYKRIHRTE
jgi:hypothetical protein